MSRPPLAVLCALLIAFLCCRLPTVLSVPEFALLDAWFALRPPRTPDPRIALVAVDEQQLAEFRRHRDEIESRGAAGARQCACDGIGRDTIATAVDRLNDAGARVIALDIEFGVHCPRHDEQLCAALSRGVPGHTDIVLLCRTSPTPGEFHFEQLPAFLRLKRPPLVASPVLYNPNGKIRGVRLVQEDAPRTTELQPQGLTAVPVRPPLSVACYLASQGKGDELPEATTSSYRVNCAGELIPVLPSEHVLLLRGSASDPRHQDKHAMLINWAGNPGTFPLYSLRAVQQASVAEAREWFGGKIVLIGSCADRQLAPLTRPPAPARPPLVNQADEVGMAGLEVQANAIDTLLQHRFVWPAPAWLMWLLIAATSWLTIGLFRRPGGWRALGAMLAQVALLMVAAYLLMRADYWLYAFTPSLAMFISAIVGAVWGFTEARQTAVELADTIEARDAATSTLVHDLKQPLAAISALAQVLRAQEQAGQVPGPELIERIQQQVRTALGDIDSLLSLDPGRQLPLELARFDLAALARDLALPQALKSQYHEVEVRATPPEVWVHADVRYIGRALSNLIDNAIKYWPDGGTIVVEVRREPGQARVRVIDHGLGIAPEAQARLFSRFQRAVPAGVDIPGTGIGLYSVRRIAEAHGGAVQVISAPGEGSIFEMTLPLAAATVSGVAATNE